MIVKVLLISIFLAFAPVLALAQNWPAAAVPLTGTEPIPCIQSGAYHGCTPAEITSALQPVNPIAFGAHGDFKWASFEGSVSGTTLTVAGSVINTVAAGQTVGSTGTTILSQLTGSPGGAGTYHLSGSASVVDGALYAYSGHDDTAAIQAALNTNQNVFLGNGAPTANQFQCQSWFGISAPLTFTTANQQLHMGNACLVAIPGFSGSYMLNVPDNYNDVSGYFDAGQQFANQAVGGVNFTGFEAHIHDIVVNHSGSVPICLCNGGAGGDAVVEAFWISEWGRGDFQYQNNALFIGECIKEIGSDNRILNGTCRWTGYNNGLAGLDFNTLSGTTFVSNVHVYEGLSSPGPARVDACDMQVASNSNGAILKDRLYLDNGKICSFNSSISIRGTWGVITPSITALTDGNLVDFNPDGRSSPFPADFAFLPDSTGLAAVFMNAQTSGTALTVNSISSGAISAGMFLSGASVPANTQIVSGSAPNWVLNQSAGSISAEAMTAGYRMVGMPQTNPNTVAITGINGSGAAITFTVAAWPQNAPQPLAGSTFITVGAGAPFATTCSTAPGCTVASSTPTTVVVTNATGGSAGASGTIQDTWSTDWSGIPALTFDGSSQRIDSGPAVIIDTSISTTIPDRIEYRSTASIWYRYQIGANSGSPGLDIVYTNVGITPKSSGGANLGSASLPWGAVSSNFVNLGGASTLSHAALTITSGLGSSPTVDTGCTTASCIITVGSGSPSTTTVLAGFAATNQPVCTAQDEGSNVTARQTASTSGSVTFTWSSAPTATTDKIAVSCVLH